MSCQMCRLVSNFLGGAVPTLTLAVAAMIAGPAMAQTADGARVFLVLDASGSMWGRVQG